ncbi:MAG: glycosyltransferase [Bacteroidota bacterium]|nr:glycosyltransferase [Bacteroidota bacterium]
MRCLYIVKDDPLSPNWSGGGAAIYYDQLLHLKSIGCTITLLHYASESARKKFIEHNSNHPEEWRKINEACREIVLLDYKLSKDLLQGKLINKLYNLIAGHAFRTPREFSHIIGNIKNKVKSNEIGIIWAQHLQPAILALNANCGPVVFMHHDWLFRIKAIKNDKLENIGQKNLEYNVCRKATSVVSGSSSEFNEIYKLGQIKVFQIPVTYDTPHITQSPLKDQADIVHLGGMGTTANRIGLSNFIFNAWDSLGLPDKKLVIAGSVVGAGDVLENELRRFSTKGFVKDLSEVMHYGDIHIIPWHKNTGQRTRLPLVLAYGQVVVAVRQSIEGFPEMKDNYNCFLVNSVEEMPDAIKKVMGDLELRKYIADNAQKTYKKFYSKESVHIRYRSVLSSINEFSNK